MYDNERSLFNDGMGYMKRIVEFPPDQKVNYKKYPNFSREGSS